MSWQLHTSVYLCIFELYLTGQLNSNLQTKDGQEWDGTVLFSYKTSGDSPMALGTWVSRQLAAYGKGTLEEERIARLNAIGLQWRNQGTTRWNDSCDLLEQYVKEQVRHGNCTVCIFASLNCI